VLLAKTWDDPHVLAALGEDALRVLGARRAKQ
jgi:hypothetical protein